MGVLANRIVIQLVLKPGAYNQDMALLMTDVNGYYESRTFYSPSYDIDKERVRKDARTTIFWEPEVTTDKDGQTTISYFNADPKTRVKVSVQGLSSQGSPISASAEYWVK